MKNPVIVIGGGGHAKVLIDMLLANSVAVHGFTDPNPQYQLFEGIGWLGDDEVILKHSFDEIFLANGLGSIRDTTRRRKLFSQYKSLGYDFVSAIHPSAQVASGVTLSEGVQIMAGVVVQAGSRIGENTIVNTKASVDHDCIIGNHVHIAPGVTISGGVRIGDNSHIGVGATVIEGVRIGMNSIIGAGALVLRDVVEGTTVVGVPAKEISDRGELR